MTHLFLVSWRSRNLVFSTLEGRGKKKEKLSLSVPLEIPKWYQLEQSVQFHLQKTFVRTAPSEERVQCRNAMLK